MSFAHTGFQHNLYVVYGYGKGERVVSPDETCACEVIGSTAITL